MDIEREIIEKSYAKLKEATGYLCDDKENDYDCALDELYNAAKQSVVAKSATSEEVAEAIEWVRFSKVKFERELEAVKNSKSDYGHDALVNTIKTFKLAITALQAYQPWVSVSERLPEKSLDVLTFRKNGNSKVLRFENDCKWYDSYNEWETDVTHWCPLPEPPKGE